MNNKVIFSEIGNPNVLKLITEQLSNPLGSNFIRIKQFAIGVNYIDTSESKNVVFVYFLCICK